MIEDIDKKFAEIEEEEYKDIMEYEIEKEKIIKQILEYENTNLDSLEIPNQYMRDYDIALAIAKKNGAFIDKVDKDIINKEIILEALKSNFYSEKYVSEDMYDDKDIVLFIVNKNGHLLWKASDRLIDDFDVVATAIKNDPDAIMFASKRLKDSQELKSILNSAKEAKKFELEKEKMKLENKVSEFKNKPIWWQDSNIVDDVKLDELVTNELIEFVENKLKHKLPKKYLELLKSQNGGRLIKRYYYFSEGDYESVFEIDSIYGISSDLNSGIIEENISASDWSDYINLNNNIVFGDDISGGHAHYLFDYTDLNENGEPKIIWFDNEVNERILLSNSFEEFVNNLKIQEEVELNYF